LKVLHILHRSVPGTHGYAVRSQEIVGKQAAKGLDVAVVTSPSQAPAGKLDADRSETIHGVRYYRSCGKLLAPHAEVYDPSPVRSALRVVQNISLLRMTLRLSASFAPDVIHAHSPFTCGLVGDIVGHIRGIPAVYEMRGIWEDSHTGRYGLSQASLRYRGVRGLETIALRKADHCVVIADALSNEVVSRGVPPERITVIPNGVDCSRFIPGEADPDLARGLGLQDSLVMGYIGYFFHYEGLDLLFQAFASLANEFPMLKLLLVGDGELMAPLQQMAKESGLASRVVFTGRVSHDRILDYYRLFHLLTLPRRLGRESSLVTPLKPLEIMAMGKPLVASDVGGHLEIVEHRVNGLLFKSDSRDSLVDACRTVLQDEALRRELGRRARKWVETNRDWNVLVQRYVDLYEKLRARGKDS